MNSTPLALVFALVAAPLVRAQAYEKRHIDATELISWEEVKVKKEEAAMGSVSATLLGFTAGLGGLTLMTYGMTQFGVANGTGQSAAPWTLITLTGFALQTGGTSVGDWANGNTSRAVIHSVMRGLTGGLFTVCGFSYLNRGAGGPTDALNALGMVVGWIANVVLVIFDAQDQRRSPQRWALTEIVDATGRLPPGGHQGIFFP